MKHSCCFISIMLCIILLMTTCIAFAEPVYNLTDYKPVRLTAQHSYLGGRGGSLGVANIVYDPWNNYYSDCIFGWKARSDGECFNVYDLGGKYHYLTATITTKTKDADTNDIGEIMIYGDGKLLWSNQKITSLTKPEPVQVDISNVMDLKIEIYADYPLQPMLADPILLMDDPGFFDGAPEKPSPEAYAQAIGLQTFKRYRNGDTWLSMEQNVRDIRGNKYDYALIGFSPYGDGKSSYNTYDIKGDYQFLTATVGLLYSSGGLTENAYGIIRIFGDDRLLWSDEHITPNDRSYDIAVYIGNVKDLKIVMYTNCKNILANPMLLPAVDSPVQTGTESEGASVTPADDDQDEEISRLTELVESSAAEINNLQTEIEEYVKLLGERTMQVSSLTSENAVLVAKNAELNARIETLTMQLADLNARAEANEAELTELNNELEALKASRQNIVIRTGSAKMNMNFREQPSTEAKKISRIEKGTRVFIFESPDDGEDSEWVWVGYNGRLGYVMKEYIEIDE